ncbi:MAG: pyrrolo-quinoline quinone [Alphaproteobacteria bacterium]|nr:MAG: pyrrolo-quinoline quinone [Alphaproteobacteria bacterium]
MKRILVLLFAIVLLPSCDDDWFGKAGDPILPGTRIPILLSNNPIEPDPSLADAQVIYPPASANPTWPMAGGYADHVMQHLALNKDPLQTIWTADIGDGSSRDGYLVNQPVAAGGKVFTIDVSSEVRAFDLNTGALIWSKDLVPDQEDSRSIANGGLAVDGDILYVTTGLAELTAMNVANGDILWRQPVSSPLRTAPTVAEGKILVVPVDNRLTALTAKEGKLSWMYEGLNESAALLGGASPAISNGIALATFTTGDLIAFDLKKGRPLWVENLSRVRRGDLMATITSVQALPAIHDGKVYAIGHSNRMLAIDLQSGERIWDLSVGGTETPWVTDNYVYIIDNSNHLICVEMARGLVKWSVELAHKDDAKNAHYAGPVLAGGRLFVVGGDEKLWVLSPQDGKVIGSYDLPGVSSISPIVAENTLLVLTDNGKLVAFR